jgi:hypothetical protein
MLAMLERAVALLFAIPRAIPFSWLSASVWQLENITSPQRRREW